MIEPLVLVGLLLGERLVAKREAENLKPIPARRGESVGYGAKLLAEIAEHAEPALAGRQDTSEQSVGQAWRIAASH